MGILTQKFSRRDLITKYWKPAGVVAAVGIGMSAFDASVIEPYNIQTKVVNFATPKWPAHYAPLKIVVATDLHVGCPSNTLENNMQLMHRINVLKPDMVFAPGDFLNTTGNHWYNGVYEYPQAIGETFGLLECPRIFATRGNHDWYNDPQGIAHALESNGVTLLENNATKIRPDVPIWIAGVGDYTTGHSDLAATFSNVADDGNPVLVLCHDPASFTHMPGRSVLTVAGHTHGGQVRVPFVRPLYLDKTPLKYVYGTVNEPVNTSASETRQMIVSSGLGTSLMPVRFGRLPEIVVVNISYAPEFGCS